jgi:hypothetical protein
MSIPHEIRRGSTCHQKGQLSLPGGRTHGLPRPGPASATPAGLAAGWAQHVAQHVGRALVAYASAALLVLGSSPSSAAAPLAATARPDAAAAVRGSHGFIGAERPQQDAGAAEGSAGPSSARAGRAGTPAPPLQMLAGAPTRAASGCTACRLVRCAVHRWLGRPQQRAERRQCSSFDPACPCFDTQCRHRMQFVTSSGAHDQLHRNCVCSCATRRNLTALSSRPRTRADEHARPFGCTWCGCLGQS